MRTIDPNIFARLMRLPENHRFSVLELLGSSRVADGQASDLIESLSAAQGQEPQVAVTHKPVADR